MLAHPVRILIPLILLSLLGTACDRSRKALLATPDAATTGLRIECPQVDNHAYPDNRAFILVTDQSDRMLTDFSIGNFVVSESGKPTVVTGVSRVSNTGDPLSIVLCLDRSGSMGGQPTADTNSAAKQFIDGLGTNDNAEIIDFATEASITQSFTSDKTLLKQKIDAAVASGSTALYDSIGFAARELKNRSGRKFILVLTDGNENASVEFLAPDPTADMVNKSGIAVYIIGLGSGVDAVDLKAIADKTGGRFYETPSSGQLTIYFRKILDIMQNLIEVTFRSRESSSIKELTVFINYGTFTGETRRKYGY